MRNVIIRLLLLIKLHYRNVCIDSKIKILEIIEESFLQTLSDILSRMYRSYDVCERMNKTLQNKVRTMLSETNLPKHLWGEAIRTYAYHVNCCPALALYNN